MGRPQNDTEGKEITMWKQIQYIWKNRKTFLALKLFYIGVIWWLVYSIDTPDKLNLIWLGVMGTVMVMMQANYKTREDK
jgi:hypothetical protein